MQNYKNYLKKILDFLGHDYKLSKTTETLLNLVLVEFGTQIIQKSNELLHPIDYEKQKVVKFQKKQLRKREIQYAIMLLFPENISSHIVNECYFVTEHFQKQNEVKKKIHPRKVRLNFPLSLGETIIQNNIVDNVTIEEDTVIFFTTALETFVNEILEGAINENDDKKTITNTSIKRCIEKDKELKKIFQVLRISI